MGGGDQQKKTVVKGIGGGEVKGKEVREVIGSRRRISSAAEDGLERRVHR